MLKKWLFGEDDTVDEDEGDDLVDPILEQRRKEKFSEPLIYNDFSDQAKEDKKPEQKKAAAKPAPQTNAGAPESNYKMSQIISPMSGLEKDGDTVVESKQVVKKKKFKVRSDELIPVISPFYGPADKEQEEAEETEVFFKKPKKVEMDEPFDFDENNDEDILEEDKDTGEVIDSVEDRLRNLANITEKSQDDLKIIEERTGEFKLDLKKEDDSLIDEIDDNMSLDELMNLYEKKFKD